MQLLIKCPFLLNYYSVFYKTRTLSHITVTQLSKTGNLHRQITTIKSEIFPLWSKMSSRVRLCIYLFKSGTFSLPLPFMSLMAVKSTDRLGCRSTWVCLKCPWVQTGVMHSWQEHQKVMLAPSKATRRVMRMIFLTGGDISFYQVGVCLTFLP